MNRLNFLAAVIVTIIGCVPAPAFSEANRNANLALMGQYLTPRSITRLEWSLLEFNVAWSGAFVGSTDYITSYPVSFDQKALSFRTNFRVQEQRSYDDLERFFRLPRPRREAILQGGVDHLKEMLSYYFPEVKSNPSLLYVEFIFRSGGGTSVVAKYENGKLELSE
jgi:hypothetical protein